MTIYSVVEFICLFVFLPKALPPFWYLPISFLSMPVVLTTCSADQSKQLLNFYMFPI